MLSSYNRFDIPVLVSEIDALLQCTAFVYQKKSLINLVGKGSRALKFSRSYFFRISKLPGG